MSDGTPQRAADGESAVEEVRQNGLLRANRKGDRVGETEGRSVIKGSA
ncbi:MAG: hypothetical protein IJ246_13120 [Clostridia bacterium]|nr:hypothetical protein [Clostridia bacterium]